MSSIGGAGVPPDAAGAARGHAPASCPICASRASAAYARWPDFAVLECVGCGFRYIDTADPAFPANAQYVHDEETIGPVRPYLPHIRRRVRDVMRYATPPGRALDIGCGKGEVALALAARGFECTAIDMKERLIAHLRTRHPQVDWRRMQAAEAASLGAKFDVITLYHVLEHTDDPLATLATVKRLASPGALVVVEVPNVAGLEARLKGRRWHYYKVDHTLYFRPRDLERLAARAGFQVLGLRGYQHFSYPQDVAWKDAVKGLLAWLGFRDVVTVFLRAP
jgi:2-polyprenyl-3-methyl-5-hydroxy-6-metoxy-1,4-benzoquinol methylase